jgi:hypothetical protein
MEKDRLSGKLAIILHADVVGSFQSTMYLIGVYTLVWAATKSMMYRA